VAQLATNQTGPIPRISDASIITAFRQGVRDKKMLEKLAMHDVETVTTLFTLADKCARATEGHAWHSAPQTGVTQTGGSGATTQGGGKKNKKNRGHDRPQSGALVAVAATGGRDERDKRPRQQGSDSGSCPVHPNSRHSASECREILKLAKRISERHEQASKDGSPPRRRPSKEKVDEGDLATGEWDLGYQAPEQVLKDILTGDSDSGDDNNRHKKLYVMYGGSWELTSRRNVKSLRHEVLSATPGVPKAAHINGGGAPLSPSGHPTAPKTGQGPAYYHSSPLLSSHNMRLHHVLIDGGARLNVISHAAFKQLQIPGSRLGPSRPFSGVGPQPVYPLGSIALPITFGTEENIHTENVQFDVAEVNLPFNAIIGRLALYRFMDPAALVAVEKLHALAEEAARPDGRGGTPRLPVPRRLPRCLRCNHLEQTVSPSRPSGSAGIPPRPLASRAIWRRNRKSRSSPSSMQMPTYSHGNRRRCLGSPGR
jgi:hypothetical protein